MRWIMIVMTLGGFALAFLTRSPGLLGLGLAMGFIGAFGAVLAIASERIAANARPDAAMLPPEAIAAIRARAQAQAAPERTPASPGVNRQK